MSGSDILSFQEEKATDLHSLRNKPSLIGNENSGNEKNENSLPLRSFIEISLMQSWRSLAQNKKRCKETRKSPTHIDFSGMGVYPLREAAETERDP